jgi:RNA polymerase sporulation-specific sigma factor
LSDEELAGLAAHGDDRAMSELIARMEPFAKAKAARFPSLPIGEEDLLQEGMLGFLNAVRTFRPEKGASFRSYAAVCIQNSILSAVRGLLTRKSAPNRHAVPYEDDVLQSLAGTQSNPLDEISARERERRLEAFIGENLSKKEKEVLAQRLAGKSQSAIANALGISPKSADNALQRIRRKLKNYRHLPSAP